MTDTLLRIGAPTVTYSGVGNCWLVDTGALVPIAVPGRRLAYEIAAAYVPPVGSLRSTRDSGFATANAAGADAPGSDASPRHLPDPGAPNASLGVVVGAPTDVAVGAPIGAAEVAA